MIGTTYSFLGLASLTLCICHILTTQAEILLIDNFKNWNANNMEFSRKYASEKELRVYPSVWDRNVALISDNVRGINIENEKEYLIEPITIGLDMRGKTLKVDFSSFSSGTRILRLFTCWKDLIETRMHFCTIRVTEGLNQIGYIPLVRAFGHTVLTRGYAFAFEGPLIIHRLELIDSAESSQRRI